MKKVIAMITIYILFSSFLVFFPINSKSDTIVNNRLFVGGVGEGNYSHIQDAINAASENDIIMVYNGTYNGSIIIDKPLILMGIHKNGTILDSYGYGDVITVKSDNVSICGFTIKNGQRISWPEGGFAYLAAGIRINSNNADIYGNNIFNNTYGIIVEAGSNNVIHLNKIQKNGDGVKLSGYDNLIDANNISNNNQNFSWSQGESSNNGIILNAANNNTIHTNIISNHHGCGINISILSTNNNIYVNNFLNNFVNAFDDSNNSWDNGIKGNYWSDYKGIDETYDEIGDTPYLISGGDNKDNCPLMKPYEGEYEFIVDEESLYRMLVYGMIAVIVFLLPIAYLWYKKRKKK